MVEPPESSGQNGGALATLVSYFQRHADAEKRGQVCTIKEQLNDETKLYLLFLKFIIPTANAFNIAFQATDYTTIHVLHAEMKKLTKRLLLFFIDIAVIDATDITKTPFQVEAKQLDDEALEVGDEARSFAKCLCEDGMGVEVDRFFQHVCLFYAKFVFTVFLKVPFQLHPLV